MVRDMSHGFVKSTADGSVRAAWLQFTVKRLSCAIIATGLTAAYTHSAERALAGGLLGALLTALLDLVVFGLNSSRLQTAWLSLLNTDDCGTYTIDYRTGRVHASDSWNAMLGYDRDTSPTTREQFIALIDEEDRPATIQKIHVCLQRQTESLYCEFRIKRGDGASQWVRTRAKVVEWSRQGKPIRLIGITWDVDKSRRAAEHQAEMTRFMESTLSSIPAHIAVIDAQGKILVTNANWNDFQGPPNSLGERPAVGAGYLDRLRGIAQHADKTAELAVRTLSAVLAGESGDARLEYETGPENARRFFALRFIRFDLLTGPRVTVIHREVTETRNIERSLRESEERWKFAIDGSGDAVWDWNVQSNSMHRSAHFLKMLGRSSGSGYDTFESMQDLVHPEDAAHVKAKYAGLIYGIQDLCAFEHRLKHRDGSWRCIMARCTVIQRDSRRRALRILGVHTDITALKQAESQLRAQQAENKMLALVAEHTTNSVIITDGSGVIEWANRGFEAMTGYSLDEVRGRKPVSVLEGPGTDPGSVGLMREKIFAGEPVRTKIQAFRKDRRPFWASIEIQTVRNGQDIRHFVAVMEDVTEREKLESERHLSQKLQSVGQLAAGIAHEINTPVQFVGDSITFIDEAWHDIEPLVNAVRGSAELRNEDVDFLLENFPVAIARARDGLTRVSGIVRAMKEFAHPDQGDFSRADLNRAVQNAAAVARNEYKYFGIVEFRCGVLPMVSCRISSISQVLLNLIVNAGHALADQGRTPDTGRIVVSTRREADWIVLSVSDNGCGIPDDIRDRIFDPFFTSKEVGRGTGQGLAIARAIVVEQHGGRIVVQSKAGEGSTFEVWLHVDGPSALQAA